MIYLIIRRLFSIIPVIFFITIFIFVAMRLIPGDPIVVMYGKEAVADVTTRAIIEKKLGLDQPLISQYVLWIIRLSKGDLGTSFSTGQPVFNIVIQKLYWTFFLTISSTFFAIVVALPLSVISALYYDTKIDHAIVTFLFLGQSLPNFWIGIILILVFSLILGWFPSFGAVSLLESPIEFLRHILLPTITLGSSMAYLLTRILRSGIVEEMDKDYVRTARAKGGSKLYIVLHHVLKNAISSSITIVGLWIGSAMSGAVVTESIFAWPGIGQLLVQAIRNRDYPLVQFIVLVVSFSFILINLVVDILYSQIDPRIQYYNGG